MEGFAAPSVLTALIGGVISFVSPCVLPLIPAYISYISGYSVAELQAVENRAAVTRDVFFATLAFVLGFSVVFVALGASASAVGNFLAEQKWILEKIAGVIIVIFGIHLTGLFRIKFLDYEKKAQVSQKPMGLFGAFVMGVAFAFGWTPCIGPILGAILAIAAVQETVGQGMFLLFVYSLGLGIPFILSGLFMNLFFSFFGKVRRYFRAIEITAGVLLILAGVLIFTGQLQQLATYLPQINLEY